MSDSALPFSLVIPCYNEEEGIVDTLSGIRDVLSDYGNYEVIVVNDGSHDRSVEVLQSLLESWEELKLTSHEKNRGYGAALKTGVRRAKFEHIVIIDADGTYPIDQITVLVEECRHADMVVGARTGDDVEYPLIRKIPKVFLRAYASWLTGTNIPDINSGLRVFRRELALKFLNILPDTFSFTTTITMALLSARYDVRFIPINYKARVGQSKIKPIRDTLRFVQLILRTGMYFAPLRVFLPFTCFLFTLFLLSFGYDIFYLDNLTDKTVLLLLFTMNTMMFALLADMIDKRSAS